MPTDNHQTSTLADSAQSTLTSTTASADAVLSLIDVHKSFGSLKVLDGLQLAVSPGEVFGFLGRNGAGKSTAIRILMGITQADSGSVNVFGQALAGHVIDVRQRIGYVAQEQNMYPWMTPRSLSKFVAGFYPRWDEQRYLALNRDFELPPKRRIGTFSGGMKAKLALALALATRPELLVLDEPTAGMDPVARREFLDLVREQTRRDGSSTFFSTHLIDEIEAIADRIGIVEEGRTRYEGGLDPLRNSMATWSIAVEDAVAGNLTPEFAADVVSGAARGVVPGVVPGSVSGPPVSLPGSMLDAFDAGRLRILQQGERRGRQFIILQFSGSVPQLTAADLQAGWQQDSMSLEDVFIAVVNRDSV